jgi:hypothetical protein
VLGDADLRHRLGAGAVEHARGLDWDRAARAVLDVVAADARRRARARRR